MRATLMYGAGDVRVENVPDPAIREPTDAIVRVLRAAIACKPRARTAAATDSTASAAGRPKPSGFRTSPRHPAEAASRRGLALLPGLLTLADVLCTGYHCAVKAGVGPRTTVTVIGDGGVISRAGIPRYTQAPIGMDMLMRNLTLTSGVTPPVPTWNYCCQVCWMAPSSQDESSIARPASTTHPTATGPWTSAKH